MQQNGALESALELARLGFRIHPLQERNKVPILGRWQERASTEEATIRLWAVQFSGCNFGVATGAESGVIVIDIDPKNGGDITWNKLVQEYGTPTTALAETGSGGWHYYFANPDGMTVKNSSNKVGKGIDVRGENGQVVAPGSIHPNGNPYKWVTHPKQVPPAPVPDWLLKRIQDSADADYTALGDHMEAGTRNDSIYHNALSMARQGVAQEFAVEAIKYWISQHGKDAAHHTEEEVIKTVDSAYKAAKERVLDVSERSDTLNAELLIGAYGTDLMYVPGIGWHHWNGKVWEPDPDDAVVTQLTIRTMRSLKDDAILQMAAAKNKSEIREASTLIQWAIRSMSAGAIANAIKVASTFTSVRRDISEIDGPDTHWLLNCDNGTVDLRTGQVMPHGKDMLITKLVPIDYNPEATAPFWQETFDLIFDGNKVLIEYMQRALGYSITGSVDERCFFICWGEAGANGKSTILETVQDVLGLGYSQMSDMVVITSSVQDNRVSSSLAKLQGARFVSMNEAEENQRLSEALVKQLTGGDTIQACYKYKNPFEYKPVFKLWVRTNEKPVVRSQNAAIWDRIKLIPFERSIPKDKRLPRSQVDYQLKAEQQGILTWLVQGAMRWKADGLQDPPEVTAAVQGYRVDSDIVRMFVEECMEDTANGRIRAGDAYTAFTAWCRDAGEKYVVTRTKFTQRLSALVGHDRMSRSNGQTYVLGLKFNSNGLGYSGM